MSCMGFRFPLRRTLWHSTLLTISGQIVLGQTPYNGHCQVTSTPLQVRAEGLTERFGDVVLACSGGTPGSILTGGLALFYPVGVTNRVDVNNQTHDAVVSVDSGSGFAPLAVAGQVSGNNISFNGIRVAAPSGGLNLKVSGVR